MNDTDRLIGTLLARIEELETLVKQQATRIAELEKRVSKNSSNSSRPPSSDGLGKPPCTTSLRENGKNKSGGQKGHKGETLKQIEHPDKTIPHALQFCPDCDLSLGNQPVLDVVKRQVFDIPLPKVEVTEHQAESKYCSCCNQVVTSIFPEAVKSPAQYGALIRSWVVYYQNQHFIPEDRLQQLFIDMYGVSLATATFANYNKVAFEELSGFEETSLSMAKKEAVKHLDETGFRVAGKTQWLHTLSTTTLTYYHVSPTRKSSLDDWKSIKSIIRIDSVRDIKGKVTTETRFYISSMVGNA